MRHELRPLLRRENLVRTAALAVAVGTALFCINQLDVVLRQGWTAAVLIKSVVTYFVPFVVANVGFMLATPSREAPDGRDAQGARHP